MSETAQPIPQFRTLRPDEIEVRVARVTSTGVQLLLYKDARCDMAMLDETVGPNRWQRKHDDHNNNLFCSVGIYINGEWIWKEDAGAESNTEAEKGHASDSFKRACVNWGIGRELYTAPFIWVKDAEIEGNKCKSTFEVSTISYDDRRQITALSIVDSKKKTVVYQMGKAAPPPKPAPTTPAASQPAPTTPAVLICPACDKPITDFEYGGKPYTAQSAYKKYGTCWDCYQKKVRAEVDARGQ